MTLCSVDIIKVYHKLNSRLYYGVHQLLFLLHDATNAM